jgi:hypothetical protein
MTKGNGKKDIRTVKTAAKSIVAVVWKYKKTTITTMLIGIGSFVWSFIVSFVSLPSDFEKFKVDYTKRVEALDARINAAQENQKKINKELLSAIMSVDKDLYRIALRLEVMDNRFTGVKKDFMELPDLKTTKIKKKIKKDKDDKKDKSGLEKFLGKIF